LGDIHRMRHQLNQKKDMLKNLLFIISIGFLAMACGGNTATTNTNATITNTSANSPVNTPKAADNSNTMNANKPVANTPAKPVASGPTRISFKKGETGSTQTISLAPGASVQFILGVTGAQTLFITPGSKDLVFKIVKGTDGQFVKADDGIYSVETKGNNATKSEIIFEVKNTTTKEIKSSIKVEVEDFGD